jgi:hypothetical protein
MNRFAFHSMINAPWTEMEPIRLGQVPAGLGTPDCFLTAEGEQGPLLRVDLFRSNEESFPFKEIAVWSSFMAIGWGHHLYLVEPKTRKVSDLNLGSYFGHMYKAEGDLLVASAERLFCVAADGSLLWRSVTLAIDGVIVDRVDNGVVQGQGEYDPPGGWRQFAVSLRTGQAV